MPPRPPLSSSSSFQSNKDDGGRAKRKLSRMSYDSAYSPLPERIASDRSTTFQHYPKEPLASPYDEVQTLSSGDYLPSLSKEVEEHASTAMLFPAAYGGAGYYSEPQTGRIRSLRTSDSAQYEANKEEKKTIDQTPTAKSGVNMTRRIGLWLASCYIFRQLVYICVGGLIAWIPGLLALLIYNASPHNNYSKPAVLSVGLFWWSIWLSSAWVGLWVCSLIANFTPVLTRRALGVVAVAFKSYIDYAEATKKYITFFLWSLLVWIVYLVTVWSQFPGGNTVAGSTLNPLSSSNSTNATTAASISSSSSSSPLSSVLATLHPTLNTLDVVDSTTTLQANEAWLISFSRFFAGVVICSALLLAEKVAMQWVALQFHQTTYSDRIETSNYHIKVLAILYSHLSIPLSSAHQVGSDADSIESAKRGQGNLSSVFNRAQKFKEAIARNKAIKSISIPLGPSQFPFSAEATVESSLESSTQSRKLARQIFLSFAKSKDATTGHSVIRVGDLGRLFDSTREAEQAFAVLDRDCNGSCTWEDVQSSILEIHRERMCLLASLHDIDSAVLKLDQFFMSFYLFISCVIIAALLSTKISTLLASLGTILLGLSWLIGSTAQESLSSVVWVFGKHPVDVGDTIVVPGLLSGSTDCEEVFIVEEIQLLSTILKTMTGRQIQVSNYQLAQKPTINIRRSGPMEERFTLSVEYNTPFEKIEHLRQEMMTWIQDQKRDFLPGLDIELNCLSDQSKLDLSLNIRYKSNWQDEHLKARRKNVWIVALKDIMAQLQIYGPAGKPDKYDPSSKGDTQIEAFSFMDKRNATKDGQFSQNESGRNSEQPVVPKLHDVLPCAATHSHSGPTTQTTSFNVRGRRGEDEHVGDIERGTPF